ATVLVSEEELEPLVEPVREQLGCTLLRAYGPGGDGWESLEAARERAAPIAEPAEVDPGDVHRLMYTSGTTSRPKGVMITYANLYAKNAAHIVELGLTADGMGL